MLCKSWQTTALMMLCPIREEEAFVSQIRGIRIIEWFWLDETLQIIYFQPPSKGRKHHPLNKAAHSPIQPDLECFHVRDIHSFFGAEVPGLF